MLQVWLKNLTPILYESVVASHWQKGYGAQLAQISKDSQFYGAQGSREQIRLTRGSSWQPKSQVVRTWSVLSWQGKAVNGEVFPTCIKVKKTEPR